MQCVRIWALITNSGMSFIPTTAILAFKKTKIIKMQYIDWDEMQDKEEPEFDNVIKICDKF